MAKRLDLKDLNIYYGSFHAVADVGAVGPAAQRDGVHRTVGLRQVDRAAHAEPDARGASPAPASRVRCCSTARTSTARASTR